MTDGGTLVLVLRMVVSLAIVLGLVVLFARWLEHRETNGARRARRRRVRGGRSALPAVAVDVLARHHLARGVSVQVVRVGGQLLVLGVTENGVQVLTDLGPADLEPEEDDATVRSVRAQGASAVDLFESMLRREGKHRVGPHDESRE